MDDDEDRLAANDLANCADAANKAAADGGIKLRNALCSPPINNGADTVANVAA